MQLSIRKHYIHFALKYFPILSIISLISRTALFKKYAKVYFFFPRVIILFLLLFNIVFLCTSLLVLKVTVCFYCTQKITGNLILHDLTSLNYILEYFVCIFLQVPHSVVWLECSIYPTMLRRKCRAIHELVERRMKMRSLTLRFCWGWTALWWCFMAESTSRSTSSHSWTL